MSKVNETNLIVAGRSPAELISEAVKGNANLEQLEKLLSLQERWEAGEARKAYHQAMSDFKANPPKIEKDKKVGYKTTAGGNVGYSHASLANVTEKINKELSKYGLSASWKTQQNGTISVTCKITHVRGHSEETTLSAQADTSGSKNSIQAIGSTITYLERYTLLALTGLATFDMDDDAQAAGIEYITEKQQHEIRDLLIGLNKKEDGFCNYMKIESIEKMPKEKYQQAKIAIEQMQKKLSAKKGAQ
jgi:ERF superfamily.